MKYPSKKTGFVAPGNSMKFEILFKANSLADYRDEFIVITEKNNFVVRISKQRRFSVSNLDHFSGGNAVKNGLQTSF